MICEGCRTAADQDIPEAHCQRGGAWCTCQHHPGSYLMEEVKRDVT